MPRKGKKKSSAPPKKSKGGRGYGNGLVAAPAAMSSFMKQKITFGGKRHLPLEFILPIATIGQSSTSGQTSAIIDGAGTPLTGMQLNLTHVKGQLNAGGEDFAAEFTSQVLDLLGSAFAKFRIKKCRFHYRPQSGTNSTQELVFAFSSDPVHPLVYNVAGGTIPTTSGLLGLPDSIPFAPWAPWDMDVSGTLNKTFEFYNASSSNNEGATSNAITRFDSFGSIACIASTASTTTAVTYGVLYMSGELDLIELSPISTTRPTLLLKRISQYQAAYDAYQESERKREKEMFSHSSSSSLPQHLPHLSKLEDFAREVQVLRKNGCSPEDAVRHLSERYTFGPKIMKLILSSGIPTVAFEPPSPEERPIPSRKPSWIFGDTACVEEKKLG
jgi:hypothetical protein